MDQTMQQQKPITIVILGSTGSGKSTLAQQICREKRFQAGHSLISQTANLTSYVLTWPLDASLKVKVVDAPGFSDNRSEMTDSVILSKISDFLKNEGGLHVAIYCLSALTRISKYETQQLETLSALLGDGFFNHVCIAITQTNHLLPDMKAKNMKKWINDLPGILMQNLKFPILKERIFFTDLDNFEESFLKPLTKFIDTTTSYLPEFPKEINTEDPESFWRFLAPPEIKQIIDYQESLLALKKREIEKMKKLVPNHQEQEVLYKN